MPRGTEPEDSRPEAGALDYTPGCAEGTDGVWERTGARTPTLAPVDLDLHVEHPQKPLQLLLPRVPCEDAGDDGVQDHAEHPCREQYVEHAVHLFLEHPTPPWPPCALLSAWGSGPGLRTHRSRSSFKGTLRLVSTSAASAAAAQIADSPAPIAHALTTSAGVDCSPGPGLYGALAFTMSLVLL